MEQTEIRANEGSYRRLVRPVLFVDVDGVLATIPDSLDGERIQELLRVVAETTCRVVISSAWRRSPERLEHLRTAGVPFTSCTPDFARPGDRHGAVHREAEIRAWLAEEPPCLFAILDDDAESLKGLVNHLFQTRFRVGLTREIADRVIAFLMPNADTTEQFLKE